jgi:hypothetical protein
MTDYGRGDMVGLEEVLLKSDRRSRVLAVRDSDSKLSGLFMSRRVVKMHILETLYIVTVYTAFGQQIRKCPRNSTFTANSLN